MVRQNGERIVHFLSEDQDGPMCRSDWRDPRSSTSDAREVTCGNCLRRPEWKQAWKDAAKTVKAP